MKLKKLHLQNVCGYKEADFDFTYDNRNTLHRLLGQPENRDIKNLAVLHGPNGSGKSSALDVINIVSAPWRFVGRDVSMLFRKMIFHEDYDPGYEEYEPPTNVMRIEALFEDDHEVVIELDPDKIQLLQQGYIDHDEVGVLKNDLPRNPSQHAFYSDADNPANLQKFQINSECHDMFLDIAESVYGYKCELGKEVTEYDTESDSYVTFHTDFIVTKPYGNDPIRVHYRRMSAGERKIATLLAQLCNPLQRNHYDIYLIDNAMMHIYTPRHTKMIDKMVEHFSDKQLIMTTHSTVALNHVKRSYGKRYLYDIERYRQTGNW
jgi:AAA15 family ATPase/GTPase